MLVHHLNVHKDQPVVNQTKFYVQITHVLIASYNVKFQTYANQDLSYVLIKHVVHHLLHVQNKLVVEQD